MTAIEPGAFRTDWAKRSMKESSTPIGDYDENVGTRKNLIKDFADHLPGDPRKVAEAVVMVTTLDEPPLRLLLGRDVLKAMRDKLCCALGIDRRMGSGHQGRQLPQGHLMGHAESKVAFITGAAEGWAGRTRSSWPAGRRHHRARHLRGVRLHRLRGLDRRRPRHHGETR